MLVAQTSLPEGSSEALSLVRTIRESHPPVGGELMVTGESAFQADFIRGHQEEFALVIGLIVLVTYFVLFLLLGSLLLPLKAVLMNLLSISASYRRPCLGLPVRSSGLVLHFTPGPIEPMTPIIMFCILFGLSMDYEVLLLNRVREEYEKTCDNTRAVARESGKHRPDDYRSRGDHGSGAFRLWTFRPDGSQGDGHRHGHCHCGGRNNSALPARPGDDAAAWPLELVGAPHKDWSSARILPPQRVVRLFGPDRRKSVCNPSCRGRRQYETTSKTWKRRELCPLSPAPAMALRRPSTGGWGVLPNSPEEKRLRSSMIPVGCLPTSTNQNRPPINP